MGASDAILLGAPMARWTGLTSVDWCRCCIVMSVVATDVLITTGPSWMAMYPISPLTPTATGCKVVRVPEKSKIKLFHFWLE